MTWRLALRNASPPGERWIVKAAEWNPELSSRYKTYRAIGRPRRRWEDDINKFLKLEENETENSNESDNKYNKTWLKAAKDCERWTPLENDCTMTAEERSESNARHRRNTQSRPARYVNGVRLSDDEVANITQHKSKIRSTVKKWSIFEKQQQQQLRTQHLTRRKVGGTSWWSRKKWSRTSWRIDDQELRDGLEKKNTWGKDTSVKQLRLGTTRHDQDGSRKIHNTDPDPKRDGNRWGRTDEPRCLPHFSSCCLPDSPGPLRFVAQNPRIPATSNSVNLFHQQPVFDSSLRVSFFVFDVTTHCHQQCASAHLANSASPFNRLFRWVHDPFTRACKARPLTVVGWTSLSVIVIVGALGCALS